MADDEDDDADMFVNGRPSEAAVAAMLEPPLDGNVLNMNPPPFVVAAPALGVSADGCCCDNEWNDEE